MEQAKKSTSNFGIPQHRIEAIARYLMPDIYAFYKSEEGQRVASQIKLQVQAEKNVGKDLSRD